MDQQKTHITLTVSNGQPNVQLHINDQEFNDIIILMAFLSNNIAYDNILKYIMENYPQEKLIPLLQFIQQKQSISNSSLPVISPLAVFSYKE